VKTIKQFCSRHLAALSLAAVGAFGLLSVGATAAPAALAASAASCTTVSCVQQFGDARIQERLTALDKLKSDAQNDKALTSQQIGVIVKDANDNENGLKTLKQQLDSETQIKPALTDVKNIYVQFRIFAVVIPRDAGEILLFHEQNVTARMTDAEQTISDLIQKDKDAGHDVTKLNTLYQDYTSKLSDATTNENNAQGLIPSLTPANYPGTDQTLKTYRNDLKTARGDIKDAADDLHQMTQILKTDLGGSLTPTPTSGS
jgi:DNA repair exonuclease SbcCD ATPase subunit